MILFDRRIVAFAIAGCAIVLANCSGSSVSIPAGHPGGSPTPVPTVTPSTHPTSTATATASPTATATATASPTPTATPTTAACVAPPPDPNSTQVPIVSSSSPQIINVPCYGDFTGVATIPAGTMVSGTTYAVLSVTSDSNAFSVPTDPNAGTRLLTTAISVTSLVTLGNKNILTNVTSPTMINPGHTYAAEQYLLLFPGGSPNPQPQDYVTGIVPVNHTITFNVTNPAGLSFPAGPVAYEVIYQSP